LKFGALFKGCSGQKVHQNSNFIENIHSWEKKLIAESEDEIFSGQMIESF